MNNRAGRAGTNQETPMLRFLIAQYRFGCRVGFGRRYALTRAVNMYRRGF